MRRCLAGLIVLLLATGSVDAKPTTGWILKRVLSERGPGAGETVTTTTLRANHEAARSTPEGGGSWTVMRWSDGHEQVADPSAKTWYEFAPKDQRSAREMSRGMLVGALGLKDAVPVSGIAEATGGSKAFEGRDCAEAVIRDAPFPGVTTRAYHCAGLVPEPWREWLFRAEFGGSNGSPILPFEALASLSGYPVLIEVDVALGSLRRELRYELVQLQQAPVKPGQVRIPKAWPKVPDPITGLSDAIADLNEAMNDIPEPGSKGLHLAAQKEQLDQIRRLVSGGAAIDELGPEDRSPLQLAAIKNRPAAVTLLIELGANPDLETGERRRTALHLAAKAGSVQAIQALLAAGADPKAADSDGKSALHVSAVYGRDAGTRALLESGVMELDALDSWDRTPLLVAAAKGRLEVTRMLLDAGADATLANKSGNTALSLALRNEKPRVVALLRGRGAPDVERDLFWAARNGDAELATRLLASGADPNVLGENGFSPLGECLRNRRLEALPALVQGGARPDFPQSDGFSVLHLAAAWDRQDAFEALISLGAHADARTEKDWTPLHAAASSGAVKIVESLLARTDVDSKAVIGDTAQTALHVAARHGRLDVARVLLASGLSPTLVVAYDYQPIHAAAQGGSLEGLEFFLSLPGVDATQIDDMGRGLFWYAAQQGRNNLVPRLLEVGAPHQRKDWRGRTPTQLAEEKGHAEFAALLDEVAD